MGKTVIRIVALLAMLALLAVLASSSTPLAIAEDHIAVCAADIMPEE